jgi:uncharacterized protein YkwD
MVSAAVIVSMTTFAGAEQNFNAPLLEEQLLQVLNQERVDNGLAPVTQDAVLVDIAHARAWHILQHHRFTHCSADTWVTGCHLDLADQSAWRGLVPLYLGENLGASNDPPDVAAGRMGESWMASANHRDNILDPNHKKVGIAAMCCFEGDLPGGVHIGPNQPEAIYVEVFSG